MTDYPVGPGRVWHAKGPVLEAYADTDALERACSPPPRGCGVAVGEFCVFPDGTTRHIPCVARLSGDRNVKEGVK